MTLNDIIVDGNKVRGITTAAGLWTTACVGLVVGSGFYIIAVFIVALMMFAMLGLRKFAVNLQSKSQMVRIKIEIDEVLQMKRVLKKLMEKNIEVKSLKMQEDNQNDKICLALEVWLDRKVTVEELMYSLSSVGGIKEIIGI